MGSLQEELKNKIIKPEKEKRKEANEANSRIIKARHDNTYRGPKKIHCRFCNREVLLSLLDEHNKTLHGEKFKNNNSKTNNNEIEEKSDNTTTKLITIDHQQVIIKRTVALEQKNNFNKNQNNKLAKTKSEQKEPSEKFLIKEMFAYELSKIDDFKFPDKWVYETVESNKNNKAFDIIIGLDFGTSYTKASIHYGDNIYIVDWAGISNFKDKFTLPTEFSLLLDNSYEIGRSEDAISIFTNLKAPFLEQNHNDKDKENAIIYLALVLRYIKSWWFHHYKNIVKNHDLNWIVNIGSPSDSFDIDYLKILYKEVIKSAWNLSFCVSKITKNYQNTIKHNVHVELIPEFVAQIASYTKSPQRQSDLHLLIDIGAGTVDVATFNVHKDENDEDLFPVFASNVKNLGTHYLMYKRTYHQKANQFFDASTALNTDIFSKKFHIDMQHIEKADFSHTEEVFKQISSVLGKTKKDRYYFSRNWQNGIRTFVCGGGSKCNVFIDAISKCADTFPLLPIELPIPEKLVADGITAENFHRVSVAYGLGFDLMNLGIAIPENQIEDAGRPELPMRPSNTDFDDG